MGRGLIPRIVTPLHSLSRRLPLSRGAPAAGQRAGRIFAKATRTQPAA